MREKNWFGNVFSVSDVGLTIQKAKSKKKAGKATKIYCCLFSLHHNLLKKYFILPTLQMRKSEENNRSKDPARRKGPGTREPGGARGLREEPTEEALALGRGCLPYVENTITATQTPEERQRC